MNWYEKSKLIILAIKRTRDPNITEIAGITGMYHNIVETISNYVNEDSRSSPHELLGENNGALGKFLYNDVNASDTLLGLKPRRFLVKQLRKGEVGFPNVGYQCSPY